jgi:hypothetical protein
VRVLGQRAERQRLHENSKTTSGNAGASGSCKDADRDRLQ